MTKPSQTRFLPGVLTLLAASVTAALSLAAPSWAQSAADASFVPGRLILASRAGLTDAQVAAVVRGHGGKARRIGRTDLHVVDLPAGSETRVLAALANNPMLKFAELDRRFKPAFAPNDPSVGNEWHLAKIGAPTAWDAAQGAGVTIAVLDTGVNGSHPDLVAQMVPGWNIYANSSNTGDGYGHGTAVAGTAAATLNNATGVAGVAGAAKIMPLTISDPTGWASASTIASGITYAADRGVRVVNISFDGVAGNTTIGSAAKYLRSKGGLVVVAAGNSGSNLGLSADPTMIPVSATDSNDVMASWSSYGSVVAMSAPGQNILTTDPNGGYSTWYGTSFSSPVVAGVVALMMSARPDLPNATIESLLYSTATDLGAAGRDIYYGYGRVNAAAAMAAAVSAGIVTVDAQAPAVAIASPSNGASVSGLVPVDVSASDNVGVTKVELRVNGGIVATDTASPYQFGWDSTKVTNGTYSIQATAYDAAGNSAISPLLTVSVANPVVADTTPPAVLISNPGNGSKIGNSVTVTVSTTDNAGSAGISSQLYINGSLVASGTGGSLSYKWNTRRLASGTYTIQATAQDKSGNRASSSIQVNK